MNSGKENSGPVGADDLAAMPAICQSLLTKWTSAHDEQIQAEETAEIISSAIEALRAAYEEHADDPQKLDEADDEFRIALIERDGPIADIAVNLDRRTSQHPTSVRVDAVRVGFYQESLRKIGRGTSRLKKTQTAERPAGSHRQSVREFDKHLKDALSKEVMPSVDDRAKCELTPPTVEVAGALARLESGGYEALTAHESKLAGKFLTDSAKEKSKQEASVMVDKLAHEIFPELESGHRPTASVLSSLFAKRAKPSDGSKPKAVDDETKLKVVELTRVWKASGGELTFGGQAVRLNGVKTSGGYHERAIQISLAKKGNHPIATSVSLPKLRFED